MYLTSRQLIRALAFLIFCTAAVCPAQPASGDASRAGRGGSSSKKVFNGITVREPKIFDNRTLTLRLEGLNDSLRNIQFIDQKSLAAALGLLQGFRSREFVSSLSVSTLPIPSLNQQNTTTTGNVSEAGTPLPDTTTLKTTTDRAAYTPQAPALDTLPTFSGFTPVYGENSGDLLSDQVNLTYEIFNLQMLLERSMSDRLWQDNTRLQAVVNFDVTVNPPRTAGDALAVVEITLRLKDPSAKGLSLVSLMPQEKTYNAAALSSKSNAFSGAAVAKVVQVGYSQRERSQVFYLYRDTDTVAYERMNGDDPTKIVFGWMFRPVLGRPSVSGGLRHLFAIVALPAQDVTGAASQYLNASVRTYWQKYDSKTMTAFDEATANRATRFRYGLSLNLTKPEIFDLERYENRASYPDIEVKPTGMSQKLLRPTVSSVWWTPVGPKSALISAEGNNFFTGLQVVMGDKSYATPADGLVLKSSQGFDFTTTLDALAASPAALVGRYGTAVPLVGDDDKTHLPYDGIVIGGASIGPSLSGSRLLEINLYGVKDSKKQELSPDKFPKDGRGRRLNPIVTVNGTAVPLPYNFVPGPSGNPNAPRPLILRANVPDSVAANGAGMIKVTWPFLPEEWTATMRSYDPASAFQVIRLSANTIAISKQDLLGFTRDNDGNVPSKRFCWQLRAGDKNVELAVKATCPAPPPPAATPGATGRGSRSGGRRGSTPAAAAAPEKPAGPTSEPISDNAVVVNNPEGIPDKVLLVSPDGTTFLLDVPKAVTPPPAEPKPITLNQNDAVWVEVAVKDASKVAGVEANQQSLTFRIPDPAKAGDTVKTIQVQIPQTLTAKAGGNIDLTVTDKEGKPTTVRLHIACTHDCKDNGGKQ